MFAAPELIAESIKAVFEKKKEALEMYKEILKEFEELQKTYFGWIKNLGARGWFCLIGLKLVLKIAFVALVLGAAMPQAQAAEDLPRFFSSIPDLPIMDGLQENEDEAVIFEKSEGRIVTQYAEVAGHNMTRTEIFGFYAKTLPHLGWEKIGEGKYLRENERLLMTIEKNQHGETGYSVKFIVEPAS